MQNDDVTENMTFTVVINHEEQYSIWPADRKPPAGWREVGVSGSKTKCLAHIGEVWTDMRPLSLRRKMEEAASKGPEPEPKDQDAADWLNEEPLPVRLSRGEHPLRVSLRPTATTAAFKQAIERGYVHLLFTGTRGGTELGVRLAPSECDLTGGDFEKNSGSVRIVGHLTLDYVPVRCIARVILPALEGVGHLEILQTSSS